jgi:protein gp37
VSDAFIVDVFTVMANAKQHTFQLLTKRHGRMRALMRDGGLLSRRLRDRVVGDWPLSNVWVGVSVEDQKRADLRIPALLDTPAVVRWLSCEPLLGPVDLSGWMGSERVCTAAVHDFDCCTPNLIDWVVAGGESGTGARPMHPNWPRALRDHCGHAGVPFFFKQWGEWTPAGFGFGRFAPPERLIGPAVDDRGFRQIMRRVGKSRAGRELDGRTWDQYPDTASVPGLGGAA